MAVLILGVIQAGLYLVAFGYAFALGESQPEIPAFLTVTVKVLGAPLMYLLYLPPDTFAPWGRWWGDDSNFIGGLALLNGLVWGFAIVWGWTSWNSSRSSHAA